MEPRRSSVTTDISTIALSLILTKVHRIRISRALRTVEENRESAKHRGVRKKSTVLNKGHQKGKKNQTIKEALHAAFPNRALPGEFLEQNSRRPLASGSTIAVDCLFLTSEPRRQRGWQHFVLERERERSSGSAAVSKSMDSTGIAETVRRSPRSALYFGLPSFAGSQRIWRLLFWGLLYSRVLETQRGSRS